MVVLVEMKRNEWIRKFQRLVCRRARCKEEMIKDDNFLASTVNWVDRGSVHRDRKHRSRFWWRYDNFG